MKTLAILGAGASGLAAAMTALRASRRGIRVVLVERLPRAGKKILSTGNGRCNFTNTDITPAHYHGDRNFAAEVLAGFGTTDALEFFESIGVPAYFEDGRVYPRSESAAGMLDALRFAAEDAELVTDFSANLLAPRHGSWELLAKDGRSVRADAVIVAAGGKAAPSLGSDGSGLDLMRSLGYEITPLEPSLVQLRVKNPSTAALKGIRVRAGVTALCKGETLHSESGEILFTEYGLSGIPIFQTTARKPCDTIVLDLLPEKSKGDTLYDLKRRKDIFFTHTLEDFFAGMLNKRLGNFVARAAEFEKMSYPVSRLDEASLERIADALKSFRFEISGRMGWDNAQVTAGGVRCEQFDPHTLESKRHRGLYAAGEILNVHGDCGGYNLHWAWATGIAAGRAAAERLMGGTR